MEDIEEKELGQNGSPASSEAEERFENEGGSSGVQKPLCLPTSAGNRTRNAWCEMQTKFRVLKDHGVPVLSKLWKNSCTEYGALKKSIGAAGVAYRKEKKKRAGDNSS